MGEERTPRNAPGPFYVARDQCITCLAPEAEAPSLMAFDEEASSCYFRRQPETPDETYRAIRAVWVSCCGAVRYGGSDRAVIQRLADAGHPAAPSVATSVDDALRATGRAEALRWYTRREWDGGRRSWHDLPI